MAACFEKDFMYLVKNGLQLSNMNCWYSSWRGGDEVFLNSCLQRQCYVIRWFWQMFLFSVLRWSYSDSSYIWIGLGCNALFHVDKIAKKIRKDFHKMHNTSSSLYQSMCLIQVNVEIIIIIITMIIIKMIISMIKNISK